MSIVRSASKTRSLFIETFVRPAIVGNQVAMRYPRPVIAQSRDICRREREVGDRIGEGQKDQIRGRCSTFLLDGAARRRGGSSSCFAFMPNESVSQWPRPPQGESVRCMRACVYMCVCAEMHAYVFLASSFFLLLRTKKGGSLSLSRARARIYARDDNGT